MSKGKLEKNIDSFNEDTRKFGGYLYTSAGKLSSLISNRHITETILRLGLVKGKNVLDVGCGDGTYSLEILRRGKPRSVFGFDPSREAIKSAKIKASGQKAISFTVASIYTYSPKKKFDIAIVRGVLHHLYQPEIAIAQISKYAHKVIVAEPNGYNPILKVIEKVSKYHREHEEKSYPPFLLDYWIKKKGGTISTRKYGGTVPFFCPDGISKWLKAIEPLVEYLPVINILFCGSYYVVYNSQE